MIFRLPVILVALSLSLFIQPGLASTSAADGLVTTKAKKFDNESAFKVSQAAIGTMVGDHIFTDRDGSPVRFADYRGKPLVVSLVYSSCYHICPTTTRYLAKAVSNARAALGADSFNVITIGFDTANDTPEAMRAFAKHQQVTVPGWKFLSTNKTTIERLSKELGFVYYASPNGFDHLLQSTLIDESGAVNSQIYGISGSSYDTPRLVEPLKSLVFGTPKDNSLIKNLSNRVRLFCTVYDPKSGAYYFDYSLFVGMAIGLFILSSIIFWLVREWRTQRRAST